LPLIVGNVVVGGLVLLLAIAGLDIQGQGGAFRLAPGPIVAIVLVAAQLAMTPLLRRRTNVGARDYRQWMAFKHFLKDFSQVAEWRPPAVEIWEEYLVYAIPLGVAHEVGKAIDLKALPQMANALSWFGFHVEPGRSLGDSIGGLTHSFSASAAATFATKPPRGAGRFSGGSSRPRRTTARSAR
jgi:uncharacterized membrane protein